MHHLFIQIALAIWAFASWYLAGLGPALVLLPKHYHRKIFLLAPLIGLSFFVLIGLFQITILLAPFTPRANTAVLLLISLLICFWFRRSDLIKAWKNFCRSLLWAGLVPLLTALAFTWTYHNTGFHLLVGSSDQLQYCENARQILEQVHTGSPLDVPLARQDHFVYEMTTHVQPYLKTQRRGAELMLAMTKSISGLSFQEAFPITFLCALLTLSFTLVWLGRFFLRLSRVYCIVLQFAFLSSFYLMLLHIQGSLALTVGMAPGLATLALLSREIIKTSWRGLALTTIIMAAYFSIYSEAALFNILIPTALLIISQLCYSKTRFIIALRNSMVIYVIVFLLATFAMHSVISTALGNVLLVVSNYLHSTGTTSISSTHHFLPTSALSTWNLAAIVLGAISYYDTSHFNAMLGGHFTNTPTLPVILFFIIGSLGLLGCVLTKNTLTRLMAAPLLLWMLATILTAHEQDYLRFARSLHYSMPFIIIGLVMLANRSRWTLSPAFIARSGKVILTVFVFMNIYTVARTIHFVTAHNVDNDPILMRFNENADPWKQIGNELRVSALHNAPVLISGFPDTIHPLALSIIMRTQPHVLGTSLLSFWRVYDPSVPKLLSADESYQLNKSINQSVSLKFYIPRHYFRFFYNKQSKRKMPVELSLDNTVKNYKGINGNWYIYQKIWAPISNPVTPTPEHDWWLRCNTRLTEKALLVIQQRENKPWYQEETRLIDHSEQALMPIDKHYPEEWITTRDVFAPKFKRFSNVCNVIYRNQYAVILPQKILSPLKADSFGTFRILFASGPIIINDQIESPRALTINYDGHVGDVILKTKNQASRGIEKNGHVTITLNADPKSSALNVIVIRPVKLRSMSWV